MLAQDLRSRGVRPGMVVAMASFPLESLLYIARRQRAALIAHALAALTYALLMVGLTRYLGLMGAAIAYFGGQCLEAPLHVG